MAEAMLRHRLEARGIEADVHSAGQLQAGMPMTPETMSALKAHGLDGSAHVSQQATAEMVRETDLILTMTRRHLVRTVGLAVEAFPRAFTLKELVRRGREIGGRGPGQPLDEWLRKAAAGRSAGEMLKDSPEDDIPDPVAEPDLITFEQAANQIEQLVDELVYLIWGRG